MAIYNGPPPTNTYKPMDWDSVAIPVDRLTGYIVGDGITAATNTFSGNLPGELLDYTMKYDLDWIISSGLSEQALHDQLKRELAVKLATKMMEDGHIEFTKQTDFATNSVRYKAYTWVGNKNFIEQQRKNKR